MTSYIHVLDGRIRVKVQGVKGSEADAEQVERQLLEMPGVRIAKANPITGNVLVIHEPEIISADRLLAELNASPQTSETQSGFQEISTSRGDSSKSEERFVSDTTVADTVAYLAKAAAGAIVQELVVSLLF